MKLLLDENLPKRLKRELNMFEVATVQEMGWQSKTNGELLRLMQGSGFSVLLTFDKNLQHQQNFAKHPITVLVLSALRADFRHVQPLIPAIISKLSSPLDAGVTIIKEPS
jgi:predicted nuclease of predicted toxin-antitoxin system